MSQRTLFLFIIVFCAALLAAACNHPNPTQTLPDKAAATEATDAPLITVKEVATTSAAPTSCAAGMKEVAGDYCANVEHLCLAGYPDINAPWATFPKGAVGVLYCEQYVVGHAVCKSTTRQMHFCIDTYEYPNVVGTRPRVYVTWLEANNLCKAQNKRLCNDDEWTLACEGNERLPYPYGWKRDKAMCNIERTHRSDIELTGARATCISPFGVYDMTGNVDEWARNVTNARATMVHEPYISALKGGHMLGKVRNRCRPATEAHGPGFASDVQGFRCCADTQ